MTKCSESGKRESDVRQTWVGCILLLTAVSSSAVTLGRHSGAAVIGRPLDIRVQIIAAPGEDQANLCIESDVFYGDSQVSLRSVRSAVQMTAPDAQSSLRIQASVAVNEPIVTVYVRAGCTTPFSRKYVLLADPVSEPASSSMPAPARALGGISTSGVPPQAAVGASALPPAAAGPASGRAPSDAAVEEKPVRKAPSVAKPSSPKPASVVRKPVAEVEKATPRLQLDPVDVNLQIERDPVLRLSLTMLSEPTASEEERAAAGLLWKAINASPEDILRDAQKLSILEAESKGLRAQEEQNKAAINELSASLEQAKSERFMNWLVYLLGALLLLALLGLLMLWRRSVRPEGSNASTAWWAAVAGEEKKVKRARFAQALEPEVGDEVDLELDLDLGLDEESNLAEGREPSKSHKDNESSMASLLAMDKKLEPAVSRSVATEELFDLQQQADFFISLGEDDKAIEVLRNHLQESQEPSPLAYLDLFSLYHKLGREEDYERLREDFNHVFNAGAPPYDQYSDQSKSLEDYETAFSRIEALWPQPKVLDVIEQSIFRAPGDDDMEAEVFDLEAYRELLLLHSIAKDMISRDVAKSAKAGGFAHTSLQPLKAASKVVAGAGAESAGRNTEPMDIMPQASPNLGLDIDLSDISEFSAFEASLPEVPMAVLPSAKPARAPGAPKDDAIENLIDFEVLDFTPPDDEEGVPPKDAKDSSKD